MVLEKEPILESVLGTKVGIKVLRLLVLKPYLSFGLTQASDVLGISKSNVFRVMKSLVERKIVIELDKGRKKKYRINSESPIVKELWKMFMLEKLFLVPPRFKNSIELLYAQAGKDVECFVVFGSVAHGEATERSDIDIAVVGGKDIKKHAIDLLPQRLEIHSFAREDFGELKDFVVIDCLLNGIILKGDFLFDILKNLKTFPKPYLIYRLKKARQFLDKSRKLEGEAKAYYKNLARISVGEVKSMLYKKTIVGKAGIEPIDTKKIDEIEKALAKEGDMIWLI